MWKIDSEVVFHNQLLFFEQHKVEGSHIDIERLYGVIGERQRHNSDGTPLSEWAVPAAEIEMFLEGLMK